MNTLRSLIALLWLASGATAFSQVVQFTVPFPAGGTTDMAARILGVELAPILGKSVVINNVPGEFGAVAVRGFGNARADGTQIIIVTALLSQPAPDVGSLVPLAAMVGETSNWKWAGVFAPPGTPANIVRDLERALLAALNSPGFNAGVMQLGSTKLGFSPKPGDGASLARLAGSAGQSAQAQVVRQPVAGTGQNAQADDPKVVGGSYRP